MNPPRDSSWRMLCVAAFLLPLVATRGEGPAYVELFPPGKAEAWMGEAVPFSIDLAAEGQFAGTLLFDFPEQPGILVMKTSDRPTLSSRTVGNRTFVIQTHDFALFAQKSGVLRFPPIEVRFGSKKDIAAETVDHRLTTQPFEVTIQAPPDAPREGWVVAITDLEINETWSPSPGAGRVGDAFTWTLTLEAEGYPGMLLPEVAWPTVDGVAVYPRKAVVRDKTERGDFTGTRREEATYVCEREGSFTLPGQTIRWWNPERRAWASRDLPAVTLEISGNPAPALSEPGAGRRLTLLWILFACAVVVAAGWGAKRLHPRLVGLRRRLHQRESARFARLIRACRASDVGPAYARLVPWLAEQEGWVNGPVRDAVRAEQRCLEESLVGIAAGWDGRELAAALQVYRREVRAARNARHRRPLPPLNPQRS